MVSFVEDIVVAAAVIPAVPVAVVFIIASVVTVVPIVAVVIPVIVSEAIFANSNITKTINKDGHVIAARLEIRSGNQPFAPAKKSAVYFIHPYGVAVSAEPVHRDGIITTIEVLSVDGDGIVGLVIDRQHGSPVGSHNGDRDSKARDKGKHLFHDSSFLFSCTHLPGGWSTIVF
jgi:hypothetical protein